MYKQSDRLQNILDYSYLQLVEFNHKCIDSCVSIMYNSGVR